MAIETSEKYCPICGKGVAEPTFKRFGEWACSEAHAEEHVKEVRGQRFRATGAARGEEARPPRQMRGG